MWGSIFGETCFTQIYFWIVCSFRKWENNISYWTSSQERNSNSRQQNKLWGKLFKTFYRNVKSRYLQTFKKWRCNSLNAVESCDNYWENYEENYVQNSGFYTPTTTKIHDILFAPRTKVYRHKHRGKYTHTKTHHVPTVWTLYSRVNLFTIGNSFPNKFNLCGR